MSMSVGYATYVNSKLPEEWRLYSCTDCDPEYHDEDGGEQRYEQAYAILLPLTDRTRNPESSCPIDTCPRCGSYLSLTAEHAPFKVTLSPVVGAS